MKGTKRWLSCLLVLLMIFSLASQVFADTISPEDARAQREQREWERNYEEWVSAGGHAHQYTGYTVLTEPTCSSYGEAYMYCAICGESKTEVIAKLPHTWGEWEILVEATDHSSGLRVHTCQVCGTVEQEEFDPEGTLRPGDHGDAVEHFQHLLVDHEYLDHHLITRDYDWQTEQAARRAQADNGFNVDGIGWPQTQDCLEHVFGVWVITREMTCQQLGERERTCVKCGYVEKETFGTILRPGDWRNDREKVIELQEKLKELGYLTGTADGEYGGKTADAVKRFQRDNDFTADGTIWPCQWEFLFPSGEDIVGKIKEDEDQGEAADAATVLPDAAGKGGMILDAELIYVFENKEPDADGSYHYDNVSDVKYRLVLKNNTGYTISSIKVLPLSNNEWEMLNVYAKPGTLEYPERQKAITWDDLKVEPFGSVSLGNKKDEPLSLYYNGEFAKPSGNVYHLRAVAFCSFYDGEEYLGQTKPDAEAVVRIGDQEPYDLSAKLEYQFITMPANKLFYTEGETVSYNLWLKNTSEYDIKGIKGYYVDRNNANGIHNVLSHTYSSGELLPPGKEMSFGTFDMKVRFYEDGTFDLDYTDAAPDYGSMPDGGVDLLTFAECNFEEDGKLLGADTFTAKAFVPIGVEAPGAKLEIKETSTPIGDRYTPGEKITVDYVLTNTGNLKMKVGDVFLDREGGGGPLFLGSGINLDPGKAVTVHTESYEVYDAHADKGSLALKAHADCMFISGKAGNSKRIAEASASWEIDRSKPEASMTVEEHTAPANGVCYEEGEEITYYVRLHNTGKVALDTAELTGGIDGASELFGTQSNLPAETDSAPFSFQHKVTHEEAEAGFVTFSAETTAKFTHGADIPLSASVTSPTGIPAISVNIAVSKEPENGEFYIRNETVDYVITVANTGNVTIPRVEVYDITPNGGSLLATLTDFAPGAPETLPSSCTVQGSDVAAGEIQVTAEGYAVFSGDKERKASDSFVRKTGMYEPNITIVKEVVGEPENKLYYRDNEDIKYSISVTNNGKETLPTISIIDHDPEKDTTLIYANEFKPGDTLVATYAYNVGILPLTAQEIENTAEALFTLPDEATTDSVTDTVTSLAGRDPVEEPGAGIPHVLKGDACEVTVTETDDGITYAVKHCEQHKKAADAVDEQLKTSDALSAWQYAGRMWNAQVNGMYIEMTNGAKDEEAKAAVEAEKEAFFAWMDAFEAKLNAETDDPAEAAETVALLLRDHCAELCHISRTAPAVKEETMAEKDETWISPEEPETEERAAFEKVLEAKEALLKVYYPEKADFVQKELMNTEKRRLADLPPAAAATEAPANEVPSAASEDPFSGTWYISRIDVGGGTKVNAADMGIEMTVTFSDDGTVVMTGMGQELQGTWKKDGDSAVVTADGSEAVFTPTEEGLTGVQNGSEMLFTRTAPGPGFVPAEPVAAESAAEFDGRWKATMISMQGMTMAYEAANANGSLPILPSDTIIITGGTVAYEGQEPEAFTFKDGALVEPGENSWEPDTYRLLEDGTLVYEFMGYMNIYFERVE